jgi:hypothetical protein
MRKLTTALVLAFIFVAAMFATSSLYAQGDHARFSAMMGRGMMGDDNADDDGGMMGMMKGMGRMIGHCNSMMSDDRPNDQWRKNAPADPQKNG